MQEAQITEARETSPPPYDYDYDCDFRSLTPSRGIKATDTPQWLWSRPQCQSWIIAVCIDLLDMRANQAQKVASNFKGCGPNMYVMRIEAWGILLGTSEGGSAVYSILLGEASGRSGSRELECAPRKRG